MTEEAELETVEALFGTLETALHEADITAVQNACTRLGPHVLTLDQELVAGKGAEAAGVALISAGAGTMAADAVGVMPKEEKRRCPPVG